MLSSVVNRTGDTMFDDTLGEALALAAAAVAVPECRARATGAGDAAPDGPRADDADHRGARARSLPARRRQGAARRHHRHARLVVRADAQRAGLRRRQGPRRGTGAGAVEGDRAGRRWAPRCRRSARSSASRWRRSSATTRRSKKATTPSLEALKAYSQGLRTRRTTGDFDSVPFFRRAIDLDPRIRAGLRAARHGLRESRPGATSRAR